MFGSPREDDIPGIEIPGRYFSFLDSRDATTLDDVFEHHNRDIVTLAELLNHVEEVLSSPTSAKGVDRYQLGRYLILLGGSGGREVLESVVFSPNDDEDTEIRTQYLELDPERYVAETDERVQIRFGIRSLTATGMLASLNDDRIELKSNVRGKIAP